MADLAKEVDASIVNAISAFRITPVEQKQYRQLHKKAGVLHDDNEVNEARDSVLEVLQGKAEQRGLWRHVSDDASPEHPSLDRFKKLLLDTLSPKLYGQGESDSSPEHEYIQTNDWFTTSVPEVYLSRLSSTEMRGGTKEPLTKTVWSLFRFNSKLHDEPLVAAQLKVMNFKMTPPAQVKPLTAFY